MKKQIISALLAVSAVAFAFAQDATTTDTTPILPPPVSVGNTSIDAQIRALNKEMEAKIKAIRQDYQTKLKALIGNRKVLIASSTQAMREANKDRRLEIEGIKNDLREEVRGTTTRASSAALGYMDNRRATTTQATPKGNAWGFFTRFFGTLKGANTQ